MADKDGPVLNADQNQNQNQNPNPNQNQNLNVVPDQNLPPNGNPQNPQPPLNPFLPNVLIAPGALQRPQLNWSYFKPKYAGKPDEDVAAHLLRTNDWMDTYKFQDHVKVQRFCLTLIGEARLWYESLRLINADWVGLQICSDGNTLR